MLHLVSVQASVITRCLLPRIETGYYRATFPRWCLAVHAHSYRTWSSSGWGFRWTLVCQQLFCAPTAPLCLWSKSAGCLFAGQNGVSYICYGIHIGAASHTNKKETSGESWGSMLLLVKFNHHQWHSQWGKDNQQRATWRITGVAGPSVVWLYQP